MCFTETWLHEHIPDCNASIHGFKTVRADRSKQHSGKLKGGGIAVLVNKRWCHPGHVTVKEKICTKDIELLAVSFRPYYLPREFTCVILVAVYIIPGTAPDAACDIINSVVARLQTQHPNSLVTISGDFNNVSLSATLPTFQQYVSCSTRGNKTLDLFYANIKNAYSSSALPPLGRSDHNLVLLTSSYKPIVQQQPVIRKTIKTWSNEAEDALRGCFEATDWNVLCEPHGDDINALTECVTDYINFCVDTIVPTRTVRCFPNNKPWITSDLKKLLNIKKKAFRDGDRELLKSTQKQLKIQTKRCKEDYRRKLESQLQQNNVRDVWSGMKKITGFKLKEDQTDGGLDRANELNMFFNRFSSPPALNPKGHTPSMSPQLSCHTSTLSPCNSVMDLNTASSPSTSALPETSSASNSTLSVSCNQVKKQLEKLNQNKAAGPDGVSPRVLKTCSKQLCPILQHLFNTSLSQKRVPVLWKTSCLVPVPKKSQPAEPNDFRPVALTSHIMKVLERLLLAHLNKQVKTFQDPLQFAYRNGLGVEDAIIYLLQRAHSHLDQSGSTLRVMFFDFSSAFNTIQPVLLCEKLHKFQVDTSTTTWIYDYLTNRPQFVKLKGCVSDMVVSSTGAPQGTVLSPFLFTLYTSDFQYNSESCHLQKYSDDSAVVGCISDGQEAEYRELIGQFVKWCSNNHLILNTNKTKEMIVDFRRNKIKQSSVVILGEEVEVVEEYKYLGVQLDNRLEWKVNTEYIYKKGQSRLYFLRKLRSFNVCPKMLHIFYKSVVESAISFAAICWGSGIRTRDLKRINKLIKKAGSVLGVTLEPLELIIQKRMLHKLMKIMEDSSHPLHNTVKKQQSVFSERLVQVRCKTERYRRSFLPAAISLKNKTLNS